MKEANANIRYSQKLKQKKQQLLNNIKLDKENGDFKLTQSKHYQMKDQNFFTHLTPNRSLSFFKQNFIQNQFLSQQRHKFAHDNTPVSWVQPCQLDNQHFLKDLHKIAIRMQSQIECLIEEADDLFAQGFGQIINRA